MFRIFVRTKFCSLNKGRCTFSSPLVHPVVDDGVDHGVGHGEPVEEEVDVLDEGLVDDAVVVVGVDEVDVVGQPAHAEDRHDDEEHLHHLGKKKIRLSITFMFSAGFVSGLFQRTSENCPKTVRRMVCPQLNCFLF